MDFFENMNFNIEIFSSIHHKLKKIHKMRQKPEYLHWCQCDLTLAWLLSIELFLRVMLIEWHDIVVPNNLKILLVFLLSSPVNIKSCPKIHSIHQRWKNCHSNCWLESHVFANTFTSITLSKMNQILICKDQNDFF